MAQHEAMLRTYLSKYKHPNETQQAIIKTVAQYRDLRPSFSPFVFNDGTQKQLVQLEGTIPVNYKGHIYNIPVSIWLLDTYPYNPPMAFVKPTNTMQIRPGKYVDACGKVDLLYLNEWSHPTHDLHNLVYMLTIFFEQECPVFSRASVGQRPQGMPSYPGSTPYLVNPGGMPMPGVPYPPASGTGPPGYQPVYRYPSAGSYPNSSNSPYTYPMQTGGYPLPYPSSTTNPPYPNIQRPPAYLGNYPSSQYNVQPPYPVNNANGGERHQFTPSGTVTEADLRASLLSTVEDKMKWRLNEIFEQAKAEMDVLCKTQADLNAGKLKLEKIISDLDKEKDDIDRNIQMLQEKDKEVKAAIQKMEGQQDLNIDDAVDATTPLYRQLVDAFAEEQAIEDAIYYLGEGLRKNVIELESFLKRVRELSRKQFMLRATIQKCREKAGLPPLA